jgi:hypothetical protein
MSDARKLAEAFFHAVPQNVPLADCIDELAAIAVAALEAAREEGRREVFERTIPVMTRFDIALGDTDPDEIDEYCTPFHWVFRELNAALSPEDTP